MRKFIRVKVLLAGACIVTGLTAWGQGAQRSEGQTGGSLDVAVVYNPLITNIVGGNSFLMQGGSVQVHGQFWHGLGVVADVSGLHTASTSGSSGVGLDMVTATFGPRYTWSPAHRRYAVFGQVLVGEANGMNSVFPNPEGANDSANSLALYVGGGVNVPLNDHLAVRALEADWLRTQMPNATTNVQNNLRLGAGLIYRFK
jgi:outer membrane immunogenic protein